MNTEHERLTVAAHSSDAYQQYRNQCHLQRLTPLSRHAWELVRHPLTEMSMRHAWRVALRGAA